jgi:anti-sigma factor RsiW
MSACICDHLLDFLDDGLAGADRQAFVDHLPTCSACRQRLEEHRLLEQFLMQAASEAAPRFLVSKIEKEIRRAKLRRRVLRLAGVAALVFVAVASALWMNRRPPRPNRQDEPPALATTTIRIPEAPKPPPAARVVLKSPKNSVAVPVKSHDPTVTIVWIFPPLRDAAARREKSIIR